MTNPYREIKLSYIRGITIKPKTSGWSVEIESSLTTTERNQTHLFNKWGEVIGFLKTIHPHNCRWQVTKKKPDTKSKP